VLVRSVRAGSALRLGCALGWIAVAPGACALAAVGVFAVRAVNAALARVEPIVLSAFERELLRVDLLETLGLAAAADTMATAAEMSVALFAGLFWVFLVAGAVAGAVAVLVIAVGYNLLAALGLGLELGIEEGAPEAPPFSLGEWWRARRRVSSSSRPELPE
jgi:hypothetical protein